MTGDDARCTGATVTSDVMMIGDDGDDGVCDLPGGDGDPGDETGDDD